MATTLAFHEVSKLFLPGTDASVPDTSVPDTSVPGTSGSKTSAGKSGVTVLSKASYTFSQGKTYALLGISGTGKSTALQLLAGFERPTDALLFMMENRWHTLLKQSIGILYMKQSVRSSRCLI